MEILAKETSSDIVEGPEASLTWARVGKGTSTPCRMPCLSPEPTMPVDTDDHWHAVVVKRPGLGA